MELDMSTKLSLKYHWKLYKRDIGKKNVWKKSIEKNHKRIQENWMVQKVRKGHTLNNPMIPQKNGKETKV